MESMGYTGMEPTALARLSSHRDPSDLLKAARGTATARDDASSDAKCKQLAKDFESVLLTKLFDQMQESIGGWNEEEQDGTSKQVQGLFWLHLAQDVADKGGFGLWREIYEHLRQATPLDAAGEPISEGQQR